MKLTLDYTPMKFDPQFVRKLGLEKLLQQEIETTRTRIISDTQSGQQAEGGGLKPYSASYKAAIDAGQVPGKSPGAHTPNLTATGVFIRSFRTRAVQGGAELFIEGSHPPSRRPTAKGARRKVGQANKARKAAGLAALVPVRRARPAGPRAVRVQGAGPARRVRTGGARDVPNVVIGQAQYAMGRTGWFTYSQKDLNRISKAVMDRIEKGLSQSLIVTNRK